MEDTKTASPNGSQRPLWVNNILEEWILKKGSTEVNLQVYFYELDIIGWTKKL